MPSDIVITEKSSQARDARAAVGNRYGEILPAEGHLIALPYRARMVCGTVSSGHWEAGGHSKRVPPVPCKGAKW